MVACLPHHPPAIPTIRKRNPSPSPSAVSSTSSTPSHYSNGEDKRLGQCLAGAPNKFGEILLYFLTQNSKPDKTRLNISN